jgi:renalase
MKNQFDFVIIGAGLAGIAIARNLPTNKSFIILDKARGIGGRVATRRLGGHAINHGLEEFRLEHPMLKALIKTGVEHQLLANDEDRIIPLGSLNQWMKHLAEGLNIKKEAEVKSFRKNDDYYEILDKDQNLLACGKKIIITSPAPQAKQLLINSGFDANFLSPITYSSCVQFLLLLKEFISFKPKENDFFYLKKMDSFSDKNYVYHFEVKEDFFNDFLQLEKNEIAEKFLNALNISPELVIDSHAHKWRYSQANNHLETADQLRLKAQHIYLAGDYFYDPGINGVMKSVEELIKSLTNNAH